MQYVSAPKMQQHKCFQSWLAPARLNVYGHLESAEVSDLSPRDEELQLSDDASACMNVLRGCGPPYAFLPSDAAMGHKVLTVNDQSGHGFIICMRYSSLVSVREKTDLTVVASVGAWSTIFGSLSCHMLCRLNMRCRTHRWAEHGDNPLAYHAGL